MKIIVFYSLLQQKFFTFHLSLEFLFNKIMSLSLGDG